MAGASTRSPVNTSQRFALCTSGSVEPNTCHGANLRVRTAWHAEQRYDAVATFHADLAYECLEECLARQHRTVGERLFGVSTYRRDLVGARRGDRRLWDGDGQRHPTLERIAHLGDEPIETLPHLALDSVPDSNARR